MIEFRQRGKRPPRKDTMSTPTIETQIQNLRNQGFNEEMINQIMGPIIGAAELETRTANPVPAGTINPNTGTWKKLGRTWAVAVEDVQIGQTVTVRSRAGKEKTITISGLAMEGNTILGLPAASRESSPQGRARMASRRYGTSYADALRDEL